MMTDMNHLRYLVEMALEDICTEGAPGDYREGGINALDWVLRTIDNG